MGIATKSLCTGLWVLGTLGIMATHAHSAEADTRLIEAARAQQPAVIDTLRDLVTVESGSTDHAGVSTLMTYLEGRLGTLGAKVDRMASATGGPDLVRGIFPTAVTIDAEGAVDLPEARIAELARAVIASRSRADTFGPDAGTGHAIDARGEG